MGKRDEADGQPETIPTTHTRSIVNFRTGAERSKRDVNVTLLRDVTAGSTMLTKVKVDRALPCLQARSVVPTHHTWGGLVSCRGWLLSHDVCPKYRRSGTEGWLKCVCTSHLCLRLIVDILLDWMVHGCFHLQTVHHTKR